MLILQSCLRRCTIVVALLIEAEDPSLCGCRDLITWVKAQPGAASSFLAPDPCGSWLPGNHALHALLDTLTLWTDCVRGLGVPTYLV